MEDATFVKTITIILGENAVFVYQDAQSSVTLNKNASFVLMASTSIWILGNVKTNAQESLSRGQSTEDSSFADLKRTVILIYMSIRIPYKLSNLERKNFLTDT